MDPVIWLWIQLFPPDTRAYTPREQPYYSFKLQYCTCYDTLYSTYVQYEDMGENCTSEHILYDYFYCGKPGGQELNG